MRRMIQQDERGVATIFVVLMMPVLLLFGAFVFDGGRGILARRQTQNAADAGALAKAVDCAKGITTTNFSAYQTNGAVLANTPTCGSGSTTVTMKKNITLVFVPGGGDRDVTRSATAKWGPIGSATTAPLTISACEFDAVRLAGTGEFYLHMGGNFTPPPCTGVSGSPPGGFGWLLTGTGCTVQTSADGTVSGQPGNSGVEQCVIPLLGKEILVPIYDAYSGTGSNATYTILGYATFKLTGYSFNGNDFGGVGMQRNCPLGNGSTSCIRGDFVSFTTQQGAGGPSPDMGSYVVYLSS